MSKRADPWIYLGPDDGWINIGQRVAEAIERDKRAATKRYKPEKGDYVKPKAFANPNHHGYGGNDAPWPFDESLAYIDPRYRAGIRNALFATWTDGYWKYVAREKLQNILRTLLDAAEAAEEMEKEENC